MIACVPNLLRKIILVRPHFVAFVGMGICEVVFKYLRAVEDKLSPSPSSPYKVEVKEEEVKMGEGTPTKRSPTGKKRKKAVVIKCGLQPFIITLPYVEGMEEEEKRHVVHFYALPSSSARVVAYQVCFFFFFLFACIFLRFEGRTQLTFFVTFLYRLRTKSRFGKT